MGSPLNHFSDRRKRSECFDLSPARLNSMSPSELEQAMEEALSKMSDDDYDPSVVDAYLNALDQKSPMPEFPDSKSSYESFQKKLRNMYADGKEQSKPSHRYTKPCRALRGSLVAVITAACLLGGMVVAQAAGVDVFGAIARWTDSIFTFGEIRGDTASGTYSGNNSIEERYNERSNDATVPEEYKEVQAELTQRGLPLYYPKVPKEFEAQDSLCYIDPVTDNVEFSVGYLRGTEYIGVDMIQYAARPTTKYEKDSNDVEKYIYNDIVHHIFSNNANTTAVWRIGEIECCITTNSDSVNIKELIQSVYEE